MGSVLKTDDAEMPASEYMNQLYASHVDEINAVFQKHFELDYRFEVSLQYSLSHKSKAVTKDVVVETMIQMGNTSNINQMASSVNDKTEYNMNLSDEDVMREIQVSDIKDSTPNDIIDRKQSASMDKVY